MTDPTGEHPGALPTRLPAVLGDRPGDPHGVLAAQWCRLALVLLAAQLEAAGHDHLDACVGVALTDPTLVRTLERAGAALWHIVYAEKPSTDPRAAVPDPALTAAVANARLAARATTLARLLGRLAQRRLGVVAPHLTRDAAQLAAELAGDPRVGRWPVHAEVLAVLVAAGTTPAAAVAATRAALAS